MQQVAQHFIEIGQHSSFIYHELPKSRNDCPRKMQYHRFVAVHVTNKTVNINYSDTGHPNISCWQTLNCDLPQRKSKLESELFENLTDLKDLDFTSMNTLTLRMVTLERSIF
jgi:hypothetical protein